jgi:membrane protease YdiL (CAAX protease family)
MPRPSDTPDHDLERLIDPELRREIGDPLPVTFAAAVVYWPLVAVGLGACLFLTKSFSLPGYAPVRIAIDLCIGVALAVAIAAATFGLARRMRALQELEIEFRRVLSSPLRAGQIARLALLSGAGEEFVFRGVLQPLLTDERFLGLGPTHGLVWTSLFFGALHFLPHKVFLPWTFFATVIGFLCGYLFIERESLVAPIALHVTLNALNLRLLSTGKSLRASSA